MIRTDNLVHVNPVCTECRPGTALAEMGWINLGNPGADECRLVHENLGVPLEHLRAALDYNERPRFEYASGVLLMIARAPVLNEAGNGVDTFSTCPIAMILRGELLVTVCLRDLVESTLGNKLIGENRRPAVRLMLNVLMRVSSAFIRELQSMDNYVSDIESELHKSLRNKELIRMLHVEKALIYFLTALKGNQSVLEKLRSGPFSIDDEGERNVLDDVLIENKQATDMAEIYTQIIGSLGDTFGAIVSNNLNKVMKMLTGLTIVFMVPSIIGALYGMNVPLPLQDAPHAFALLCLVCVAISIGVFYLLRKNDWM